MADDYAVHLERNQCGNVSVCSAISQWYPAVLFTITLAAFQLQPLLTLGDFAL